VRAWSGGVSGAATGDNHQAVRTGQATTARVIIAAATIMILVFSAFILSGQQTIGEIGIGLAARLVIVGGRPGTETTQRNHPARETTARSD
jgi:uncharacterized membrane protein YdfJ with MMPL/SSD domain